jgi:FkbM family methyltransferase
LKQLFVKICLFLVPGWLKRIILFNSKYENISYSQTGEDMIIQSILRISKGFYVDVGAHHPKRFSNTQLLYLLGWRGLNIEPMPGTAKLFERHRKRDVNLEFAISNENNQRPYSLFDEGAYNSIEDNSVRSVADGGPRLLRKALVQTKRLDDVLNQHLIPGTEIDLLSIDVEGHELQVLESNNWVKHKPKLIVVENHCKALDTILRAQSHIFLQSKGYDLVSYTPSNKFYQRVDHV